MVEGIDLGVGGQQGLAAQRMAVPRSVVEWQHAVGIALAEGHDKDGGER